MPEEADKPSESDTPETPFDRFQSLLGKFVKVPKKEVDKQEAAYQRKQSKKKRGK